MLLKLFAGTNCSSLKFPKLAIPPEQKRLVSNVFTVEKLPENLS